MNLSLSLAVPLFLAAGLFSGCTSQLGSVSRLPPPSSPIGSQLGMTVGVVIPQSPAAFGFEQSSGHAWTAGEGAINGVTCLAKAGAGAEQAAFVVVALLPVAALVGAVVETNRVLPPHEVTRSETELTVGLRAVAKQDSFRDAFLQVARESSGLEFVPLDYPAISRRQHEESSRRGRDLDWILELGVVDLQLQRTSLTDASFALSVNTHLRLLRAADGKVVYDGSVQFRSGTALFHSWAVDRGTPLRRVAETGYRMIAGEILERLLVAPSS